MSETKEGKHLPFKEGLPTRPDVDLLLKMWPNPKIGDVFPYETIENALGLSRKDVRFRTVCGNWRRRARDHPFSVVIEARDGREFYVADCEQTVGRTWSVFRFAGHKLHRHRKKLATFRPETEQQRIALEHSAMVALAGEKDLKRHRMNVIAPSPTTQAQPQIAPPKAERKG